MPLQEQSVSVPFSQGADTKTNPKLSQKPSRMENLVFRGGTPEKRYGTTQLASGIDTGGNFAKGEALFAFDNELVRINGGTAYGLGPGLGAWVTKTGGEHYATVTKTRLVHNGYTQCAFDHATNAGITVMAWQDTLYGLQIAVYDEVTGVFYQSGTSPFSNGTHAKQIRCVAVGANIHVYFIDTYNTNSLQLAVFSTTAPETVPGLTTLRTDATGSMDAVAYGGTSYVAYSSNVTTSKDITLIAVTAAGAVTTPAASVYTDANVTTGAIGLRADTAGNLYVVHTTSVGLYYYVRAAATFASVLVNTAILVYSGGITSTTAIAMVESPANTINVVYQFVITGAYPSAGALYNATINASGTVTGNTITAYANAYQTVLASDGFIFDGVPAVAIVYHSNASGLPGLYQTLYVIDLNGVPLAKCLSGVSGYQGTYQTRARAIVNGSTVSILGSEQGRVTYSGVNNQAPTNVTPLGISRLNLTAVSAGALPINRIGGVAHIGGAFPRVYDGLQVVEQGFSTLCDGVSVTLSAGGNLSAGVYQWCAIYSWINNRGELQRSAAGNIVTATATATQKASVTLSFCPSDTRSSVYGGTSSQIEVYRTTANGTVFYLVSSPSSPIDAITKNNTFVDTVSDAALQTGELLYTTGGVLDNLPAPAYSAACIHKNRLVIVGLEDPYAWRCSSKSTADNMVRFNDAWGGRVPSAGGPLTGCASLDDKLILFTATTFYVVFGDGPDTLGNNPFSEPQPIVGADSGATTALSIAETPDGIIFQSVKGLSLLQRDLSTAYLGADVESYGTMTFRAATLRAEVEQVWFQADNGSDLAGGASSVALVWDYHYRQWSVLTTYGAQSCCYYQGKYTRVRSDGVVFQEQPGTFVDSGVSYGWVLETAWLKPSGLVQGFMRLWRALLLGAYNSSANLVWEVAYDFTGSPSAPNYLAADSITVQGSNYTVGGPFQVRRLFRIQKCEAIKFRLTESSAAGQGISPTAIDLLFGVRPGAYRLPTTKSVG